MSSHEPDQSAEPQGCRSRVEELRTTAGSAVAAWLREFAHLETAGLRADVTTPIERDDLVAIRACDVARIRGIYPHESTPWSCVLTEHYLDAQARSELSIRVILRALPAIESEQPPRQRYHTAASTLALGANREREADVVRWLTQVENVVDALSMASAETLAELWADNGSYRTALRRLLDERTRGERERQPSPDLAPLRAAAEDGDRRAAYAWALAELNGIGKHKRPEEGVRWLEHAAELGHVEAQYDLGTMHAHGWSVPQNPVVGLAWLMVAERCGHTRAKLRRERLERTLGNEEIVKRAQGISRSLGSSRSRPAHA